MLETMALLCAGMVGVGCIEQQRHLHRLGAIPTRIHVSGTRGKSSVTRLIAAGLNGCGTRATGKTTGTLARMIYPGGEELPIHRPIGPNIIEQKRVVQESLRVHAKALVVECMALQPFYHWLCEDKLIRATHGVITNARADHLDVMGPGEREVAQTLCGMIPVKGVLFTAEQVHLPIIQEACQDRGTTCIAVDRHDVAAIHDADMEGFSYLEHKENVALVLKILDHFHIPRDKAIKALWTTRPDPGAMSEHHLSFFGREIIFVNGFAANDPQSTAMVWDAALKRNPGSHRRVGIFNLRADRPTRTLQLARDVDFWMKADRLVLMGDGSYLFAKEAAHRGYNPANMVFADSYTVEQVFERIVETCGSRALAVGMGNIGGQGLDLVRYFRNRSLPEDSP